MTYIVIVAFVAILGSLAAALVFMMRGNSSAPEEDANAAPRRRHMARALAFRVGFSIVLFICILIAWKLGYIQPTGIPAGA